jgi:hypothetical protein
VDAAASGLRIVPFLVTTAVVAVGTGRLVMYAPHHRSLMGAGAALYAVGAGLLATLQPASAAGAWTGFEVLAGIGLGATI